MECEGDNTAAHTRSWGLTAKPRRGPASFAPATGVGRRRTLLHSHVHSSRRSLVSRSSGFALSHMLLCLPAKARKRLVTREIRNRQLRKGAHKCMPISHSPCPSVRPSVCMQPCAAFPRLLSHLPSSLVPSGCALHSLLTLVFLLLAALSQ